MSVIVMLNYLLTYLTGMVFILTRYNCAYYYSCINLKKIIHIVLDEKKMFFEINSIRESKRIRKY